MTIQNVVHVMMIFFMKMGAGRISSSKYVMHISNPVPTVLF